MKNKTAVAIIFALVLAALGIVFQVAAQQTATGPEVRIVVSVESRGKAEPPAIHREDMIVDEGRDHDQVRSWVPASGSNAGLDLWVLIDDSASWGLGSQLDEVKAFIVRQAPATFVAVGYMYDGTVQTLQGLTQDHAAAANAVRLTAGRAGGGASPFFSLEELLKRWAPNPARPRREVLMITNGVDLYSPGSVDPYLDETISMAQKAGVLVYSIYTPGAGHLGHSFWRTNWGKNNLSEISEETGAESYNLGVTSVEFFRPYLDDIAKRIGHQYLLTFIAKPEKKAGLRPVKVHSEIRDVDFVTADQVFVPASP